MPHHPLIELGEQLCDPRGSDPPGDKIDDAAATAKNPALCNEHRRLDFFPCRGVFLTRAAIIQVP